LDSRARDGAALFAEGQNPSSDLDNFLPAFLQGTQLPPHAVAIFGIYRPRAVRALTQLTIRQLEPTPSLIQGDKTLRTFFKHENISTEPARPAIRQP
jgi:hypothetical protein